ncbi:MAG: cation:proton antiporter [Theionarchaea archaeon]|nr:cation:proton antiporter [Theionarchaea archaeon]MBU7000271.1 cation:proton antiporter [Theionarchaea archaeon]MBU7022072.1 cation:proton antiporter [Theionarchaea archaeon]MBU7034754.1 cation:proton antiporter [Theionarchaea archaeon]MBU7040459.1 cation:proton antiporter [Theionarchaea archaeon]
MEMSIICRTTTGFLAPLLLVFGTYVILAGYFSPGGGFQGGIILGSVVLLLFTVFGTREGKFSENVASLIEDISGLLLIAVGVLGYLAGNALFSNFLVGKMGLTAGTIPVINVLIGLKVGVAFTVLFYTFFKYLERVP